MKIKIRNYKADCGCLINIELDEQQMANSRQEEISKIIKRCDLHRFLRASDGQLIKKLLKDTGKYKGILKIGRQYIGEGETSVEFSFTNKGELKYRKGSFASGKEIEMERVIKNKT